MLSNTLTLYRYQLGNAGFPWTFMDALLPVVERVFQNRPTELHLIDCSMNRLTFGDEVNRIAWTPVRGFYFQRGTVEFKSDCDKAGIVK